MLSKSGRIRLRAPEPADAQLIYQWENDPQIWRVGDTYVPYSMFQIEEFILNAGDLYANKQLRLMIDSVTGKKLQVIGTLDMYDFDPRHSRAGVGIMITANERGKGFALEALEVFEQYAFETLNLHQLFCLIASNNMESIAVFMKRGFMQTGIRKEWLNEHGKWIDQIQFQLINPHHKLLTK
jgi:diamine N-acetyltransferase